MKRIVSLLNDEISKDPRASKFRDTLKKRYEVYSICSSFQNECRSGADFIVKKCKRWGILALFLYWIRAVFIVKKIKPDYILAHDYFMALPGWIASKLFKKPLIYDAYEFYTPQRGVKMSKRDYFFFIIEKFVIKRSNLVFSANIERSRLMKSAYKLERLPVPVLNIPNYDHSIINKKIFNPHFITVVYEGYISYTRFVDLLVDSFEYLPGNYKLVFIGAGADDDKLKKLILSKDYNKRIEIKGRIDTKDIIPALSKCDIGFVGYPFTILNNRFCSPNKIYEYPTAGIPFVSTNQSTIWRITNNYHICEYYDPKKDGAAGIAKAIQKIAENYSDYVNNLIRFISDNKWDKEEIKILNSFDTLS